MATELPPRPNLEQLKKQSKDLLERCRNEEPEALGLIQEFLPNAGNGSLKDLAKQMALHDTQLVLARTYGFANWPALNHYVESVANPLRPTWVCALMGDDLKAISKLINQDPSLVNSLHREFEDPFRYKVFPVATLLFAVAGPPQQTVSPQDVHRRINTDVVKLLLDAGADPNVHSHHGRPLSWAHDQRAVAMLLEKGGELNLWHDNGGSPLNFAVWRHGDEPHLEMLLKSGADPNSGGPDGWTPLHTAAFYGVEKLVRLLLQFGADPQRKTAAGERPIDLARRKGRPESLLRMIAN